MSEPISLRTPKYRWHKARNLAVVTIAGRDVYLGKYGSLESKQEYRRLVGEFLQTGVPPLTAAARDLAVIEVIAAYLRFANQYYRKNGELTREFGLIKECCKVLKALYGRTLAKDFGPLSLKTVRQQFILKGHSRKYINKNVERIRRMFKWAAADELIPASVPQALAMVTGLREGRSEARETRLILPIEESIVEKTLNYAPQILGDMIRLQLLTAMRPQEICVMRPTDIDRTRADVWLFVPESHKTQHQSRCRIVFLGPQSRELISRYLERHPKAYLFSPRESEHRRREEHHARRITPLSCGNRPGSSVKHTPKRAAGDRYNTNSYRRAIHRVCDKAFPHPLLALRRITELDTNELHVLKEWQSAHRWSPNRLRHTAATKIRREFGLEAAQIILGHAQADVTQIYAERDISKGIAVAYKTA